MKISPLFMISAILIASTMTGSIDKLEEPEGPSPRGHIAKGAKKPLIPISLINSMAYPDLVSPKVKQHYTYIMQRLAEIHHLKIITEDIILKTTLKTWKIPATQLACRTLRATFLALLKTATDEEVKSDWAINIVAMNSEELHQTVMSLQKLISAKKQRGWLWFLGGFALCIPTMKFGPRLLQTIVNLIHNDPTQPYQLGPQPSPTFNRQESAWNLGSNSPEQHSEETPRQGYRQNSMQSPQIPEGGRPSFTSPRDSISGYSPFMPNNALGTLQKQIAEHNRQTSQQYRVFQEQTEQKSENLVRRLTLQESQILNATQRTMQLEQQLNNLRQVTRQACTTLAHQASPPPGNQTLFDQSINRFADLLRQMSPAPSALSQTSQTPTPLPSRPTDTLSMTTHAGIDSTLATPFSASVEASPTQTKTTTESKTHTLP